MRQIRKRKKIVGTEERYVLEHEKYKSIVNITAQYLKKNETIISVYDEKEI